MKIVPGCTVPTRIIASVPKTFSQTSETSANIYVHRSSPGKIIINMIYII